MCYGADRALEMHGCHRVLTPQRAIGAVRVSVALAALLTPVLASRVNFSTIKSIRKDGEHSHSTTEDDSQDFWSLKGAERSV